MDFRREPTARNGDQVDKGRRRQKNGEVAGGRDIVSKRNLAENFIKLGRYHRHGAVARNFRWKIPTILRCVRNSASRANMDGISWMFDYRSKPVAEDEAVGSYGL